MQLVHAPAARRRRRGQASGPSGGLQKRLLAAGLCSANTRDGARFCLPVNRPVGLL